MNYSNHSVPDNWYESFFTNPINTFWEGVIPEEITAQEIAFVERHLRLTKGNRVLDVPCGAGRHSVKLTQRGYRATGVDLSADAVTRLRTAGMGLDLEVLQQDMKELSVAGRFDGAICLGNSFGYLSHGDTQRFLQAMHACLQLNARFIVDTGTAAESLLTSLEPKARYEGGGYSFEIENGYDVKFSRLVTDTVLRRGPQEWRQSFSQQVYTCAELTRLFREAGFEVVDRVANLDDEPYRLGSPRLLLIAERA